MDSAESLSNTERYATASLATLALYCSHVDAGSCGSELPWVSGLPWGLPSEQLFDESGRLQHCPPTGSVPGKERIAWGYDLCSLLLQLYTSLGVSAKVVPGLMRLPEAWALTQASDERDALLLDQVRSWACMLDPTLRFTARPSQAHQMLHDHLLAPGINTRRWKTTRTTTSAASSPSDSPIKGDATAAGPEPATCPTGPAGPTGPPAQSDTPFRGTFLYYTPCQAGVEATGTGTLDSELYRTASSNRQALPYTSYGGVQDLGSGSGRPHDIDLGGGADATRGIDIGLETDACHDIDLLGHSSDLRNQQVQQSGGLQGDEDESVHPNASFHPSCRYKYECSKKSLQAVYHLIGACMRLNQPDLVAANGDNCVGNSNIQLYDARTRVAVKRVCHWLKVPWYQMYLAEREWAGESVGGTMTRKNRLSALKALVSVEGIKEFGFWDLAYRTVWVQPPSPCPSAKPSTTKTLGQLSLTPHSSTVGGTAALTATLQKQYSSRMAAEANMSESPPLVPLPDLPNQALLIQGGPGQGVPGPRVRLGAGEENQEEQHQQQQQPQQQQQQQQQKTQHKQQEQQEEHDQSLSVTHTLLSHRPFRSRPIHARIDSHATPASAQPVHWKRVARDSDEVGIGDGCGGGARGSSGGGGDHGAHVDGGGGGGGGGGGSGLPVGYRPPWEKELTDALLMYTLRQNDLFDDSVNVSSNQMCKGGSDNDSSLESVDFNASWSREDFGSGEGAAGAPRVSSAPSSASKEVPSQFCTSPFAESKHKRSSSMAGSPMEPSNCSSPWVDMTGKPRYELSSEVIDSLSPHSSAGQYSNAEQLSTPNRLRVGSSKEVYVQARSVFCPGSGVHQSNRVKDSSELIHESSRELSFQGSQLLEKLSRVASQEGGEAGSSMAVVKEGTRIQANAAAAAAAAPRSGVADVAAARVAAAAAASLGRGSDGVASVSDPCPSPVPSYAMPQQSKAPTPKAADAILASAAAAAAAASLGRGRDGAESASDPSPGPGPSYAVSDQSKAPSPEAPDADPVGKKKPGSRWWWGGNPRRRAAAATKDLPVPASEPTPNDETGPSGPNAAAEVDAGPPAPMLRALLLQPINPARRGSSCMALTVAVSGFVSRQEDFVGPWNCLPARDCERFALKWESEELHSLGMALGSFERNTAIWSSLAMSMSRAWAVAFSKAEVAGCRLASLLASDGHGGRPITFIGFSMGARLIFHCLAELARMGKRGIVEHVVLFGTPVSIDLATWGHARSVVSGRFINGYSSKDWILGVVHRSRSRSAALKGIAGLAPVSVPGVENVNLSRYIKGHVEYLTTMDDLLELINLTDDGTL